ncbi:hypothetical protein cyc_07380 [Cyclospora cayetanensis]|uniref:Uncharacterized protein n=1 Tax=Cyclospora cayetanensis TaxID=88456 RepID=A0A1D3D6F6_9EIME|nr:hypothetical protein cyc_07380 [Cyclospora cayetanensis]
MRDASWVAAAYAAGSSGVCSSSPSFPKLSIKRHPEQNVMHVQEEACRDALAAGGSEADASADLPLLRKEGRHPFQQQSTKRPCFCPTVYVSRNGWRRRRICSSGERCCNGSFNSTTEFFFDAAASVGCFPVLACGSDAAAREAALRFLVQQQGGIAFVEAAQQVEVEKVLQPVVVSEEDLLEIRCLTIEGQQSQAASLAGVALVERKGHTCIEQLHPSQHEQMLLPHPAPAEAGEGSGNAFGGGPRCNYSSGVASGSCVFSGLGRIAAEKEVDKEGRLLLRNALISGSLVPLGEEFAVDSLDDVEMLPAAEPFLSSWYLMQIFLQTHKLQRSQPLDVGLTRQLLAAKHFVYLLSPYAESRAAAAASRLSSSPAAAAAKHHAPSPLPPATRQQLAKETAAAVSTSSCSRALQAGADASAAAGVTAVGKLRASCPPKGVCLVLPRSVLQRDHFLRNESSAVASRIVSGVCDAGRGLLPPGYGELPQLEALVDAAVLLSAYFKSSSAQTHAGRRFSRTFSVNLFGYESAKRLAVWSKLLVSTPHQRRICLQELWDCVQQQVQHPLPDEVAALLKHGKIKLEVCCFELQPPALLRHQQQLLVPHHLPHTKVQEQKQPAPVKPQQQQQQRDSSASPAAAAASPTAASVGSHARLQPSKNQQNHEKHDQEQQQQDQQQLEQSAADAPSPARLGKAKHSCTVASPTSTLEPLNLQHRRAAALVLSSPAVATAALTKEALAGRILWLAEIPKKWRVMFKDCSQRL